MNERQGNRKMKLLGIESSGQTASSAIIENDTVLAEMSVKTKLTHSEILLPMIDEIIKKSGIDITEIDALAIASGPGSFTGLKIGAATVKGLGLALDKPVVPVETLEGLAYNIWNAETMVVPLMDARRGEVYWAGYEFKCGKMNVICEPAAEKIEELISKINESGKEVTFLGDGASAFHEMLEKEVTVSKYFAPASMNLQRAASVASRGLELIKENKAVSADEFVPVYLRKSQAERDRDRKCQK